jgi:hypothetical protein
MLVGPDIALQNPDVPAIKIAEPMEASIIQTQHIEITCQYPDHDPRTDSDLFRRSRHKLVVKQDQPCFICGVSYSKGGAMEAHHCCIEWAAANAIDWKKVKKDAPTLYNPQQGFITEDLFDWDAVAKDPSLFIDSPLNLLVLCSEHHRSTKFGIHFVPYPIWVLQKWPAKNFEFIPR